MTTAQRPAVKGKQGTHRGHTFECLHPDAIECLRQRHGTTPDLKKIMEGLASVMGGCDCPCHHNANGVPVPHGAWIAPGQREPIGTLHAIRLEKIEETQEDEGWLL